MSVVNDLNSSRIQILDGIGYNIFISCLAWLSILVSKAEILGLWCLFISGLTASTVLFGIVRSLLVFFVLVSSSQTLHNQMFESILRAPVLFFDRNPLGMSDIGFLNKCLVNMLSAWLHLVFENGGDAWKKIMVHIDSFSIKSSTDIFLLPEKIWIQKHINFYSSLCVCGKIKAYSWCTMI